MKDKEKTDIEKIKELLGAVRVPFSEYKDTYNKMCNAEELVVKMDEDSQESTIVENAILRAAEKGILTPDEALELMAGAITAFLFNGILRGFVYKNKKGVLEISRFNVPVRI